MTSTIEIGEKLYNAVIEDQFFFTGPERKYPVFAAREAV